MLSMPQGNNRAFKIPGLVCVSMHDPSLRRGVWFAKDDDSLIILGGREGDDNYLLLKEGEPITKTIINKIAEIMSCGSSNQEEYGPDWPSHYFVSKRNAYWNVENEFYTTEDGWQSKNCQDWTFNGDSVPEEQLFVVKITIVDGPLKGGIFCNDFPYGSDILDENHNCRKKELENKKLFHLNSIYKKELHDND